MKNRALVTAVMVVIVISGVYLYMKKHPKNVESLPKKGGPAHPMVQAPSFHLKDVSGNKVVLADYQGKAVVLNFFATWCPPCRTEIPGFVKIYDRYREKGLEIIGISLDNDAEKVLPEFITEHSINYSVAIGTRDVIEQYGGIQSIPTTIFIDRNGDITNIHMGFIDEATFEMEAKKIL